LYHANHFTTAHNKRTQQRNLAAKIIHVKTQYTFVAQFTVGIMFVMA